MSSAPQYDGIASSYAKIYSDLADLPCSVLEEVNYYRAMKPYIPGAKVLDLACGSGVYSRRLVEWGAASVLGVDISSEMVKTAKADSASLRLPPEKLNFIVGDATTELNLGGPFDLVVASWLLNYASSGEVMERMFQTVLRNLKQGGKFVSLTIPPSTTKEAMDGLLKDLWPEYGLGGHVSRVLDDGLAIHNILGTQTEEGPNVEFDNFYLRQDVFEKAAKKAGLGSVDWQEITVPDEIVDKDSGRGREFWDRFAKAPSLSVCIYSR